MNVPVTKVKLGKLSRSWFGDKNVRAWILMLAAISLHVIDESLTGFVEFYNQVIRGQVEKLALLSPPVVSAKLWLGGLILAIMLGFALTPLVYRGGKIIRVVATLLGVLMVLNACAHTGASLYLGRTAPGFWSSPLLLAAAIYLVVRGLGGSGWQRPVGPRQAST